MTEISRRQVVAGLCSAMVTSAVAESAPSPVVREWSTPESFGATGDSIADDGPALVKLSAWLNAASFRGARLSARYRVLRRDRPVFSRAMGMEGAITLIRPDHVTVLFENESRILMDNLDLVSGAGNQVHGICVRGPGRAIWLVNPRVEWKVRPSGRSQGDGIRFYGYPSDTLLGSAGDGKLENIWIDNAFVRWAPQAGVIFHGCSDITVGKITAEQTFADALHFNACRRIAVDVIESYDCGDDTCAFVTYHDEQSPKLVEGAEKGLSPYFYPELAEWSNSSAYVKKIICRVGAASGLRLAGALDVHIDAVESFNTSQSAIADGGVRGGRYGWTYFQPRKCTIGKIYAENCNFGWHARSYNTSKAKLTGTETPLANDPRYWEMDVVIAELQAIGSKTNGMVVKNIEGLRIGRIDIDGRGFEIDGADRCSFGRLYLRGSGSASHVRDSGQVGAVTFDYVETVDEPVELQRGIGLSVGQTMGNVRIVP